MFAAFTKFLFGIGLFLCGSIWYAYVLMCVWNWLAVPVVHVPSVTMAGAYALSLVVGMFKLDLIKKDSDAPEKGKVFVTFVVKLFTESLALALLLLLAYIIKGYI